MRVSQFFISTSREDPADAEVVSHRLMLRAGLVRRLTSGVYTWMPLGLRVVRKVEAVVREEMNASGAIELSMPAVPALPSCGRNRAAGRNTGRNCCASRTAISATSVSARRTRKSVSDIVRREVRSYRQLPLNLYQIQVKFRDEIRPRFGVMRGREFTMKDAYSFHPDKASLDATYAGMYDCYSRIFTRLGLRFRAVAADPGAIGGTGSHEFHVLADSGEDAIAYCPGSDYAANVELAEALAPRAPRPEPCAPLAKVATPGVKTIADLCAFLKIAPEKTVKAVVVEGTDERPVLLLLRGDHELNAVKAAKLQQVKTPLAFSSSEAIRAAFGAGPGSLGPIGYRGAIVADRALAAMADFAGRCERGRLPLHGRQHRPRFSGAAVRRHPQRRRRRCQPRRQGYSGNSSAASRSATSSSYARNIRTR
jgi:prolyl-tRNA synthetase